MLYESTGTKVYVGQGCLRGRLNYFPPYGQAKKKTEGGIK